MKRKAVAGIIAAAAIVGALAFTSAKINQMTERIAEPEETDSIYILKKKTELPQGLEQPFAAEGEEAVSSPGLWKVTDADGSYIYMLGSLHYLKLDDYPLSAELGEAYSECEAVAVENYTVDGSRVFEEEGATVGDYQLKPGDSIKNHLTAEEYELLREQLSALGMEPDSCDSYTPWYAYQTISMVEKKEFSPDEPSNFYGIDYVIQILGNRDGKEVFSIETKQIKQDLYNKLDDEMAGYLIKVKALKLGNDYESAHEAWCSGDLERQYHLTADFPGETETEREAWERYIKLLIDDRNVHMAEVAEEYLKSNTTVFYVVGAAHFYGENGLLRLLEKDGCTVQRVC